MYEILAVLELTNQRLLKKHHQQTAIKSFQTYPKKLSNIFLKVMR